MRVYHFLSTEFAYKDLREKRLKVSELNRLNDPFEFLGMNLADPDLRKAMKKTKNQLAKSKGLICFSRNWRNPVQWAHYADSHKGICLGFDIPDSLLSKVNYVDERIEYPNGFTEADMLELLTTKFAHWSYEEEYRVFVELNTREDGLYYAPFSSDMKLKQVIIGACSKATRRQVIESIGGDVCVEIFKARAAFKSFNIVRNQAYDEFA
ncbi:DUF2971 domain-containing protein [Vibrio coralliirubri]|uniref:DUF2971 domain-containing protein n=1 Tax=Vibrio coralliirubri TaxID=1516159 RepID=UPI00076AC3EA|nr:DUF2971 domain-containing protein [Vibrio coralliirubri]